jgi:hypothetical protein
VIDALLLLLLSLVRERHAEVGQANRDVTLTAATAAQQREKILNVSKHTENK